MSHTFSRPTSSCSFYFTPIALLLVFISLFSFPHFLVFFLNFSLSFLISFYCAPVRCISYFISYLSSCFMMLIMKSSVSSLFISLTGYLIIFFELPKISFISYPILLFLQKLFAKSYQNNINFLLT